MSKELDGLMKKLQKKSAREIQAKRVAEENRIKEIKKRIVEEAEKLVKENPNRGSCLCTWGGKVYQILNGIQHLEGVSLSDMNNTAIEFKGSNVKGVKFYMLTPSTIEEETPILKWLTEHYAMLKISLHKSQGGTGTNQLEGLFSLGSLSEEFCRLFSKSPLEFVERVKEFDKMVMDSFNKG